MLRKAWFTKVSRVTRIGITTVMAGALFVSVEGTAHAATSCTFTRGTDFSTVAELQTILTNGGASCLAKTAGDTLIVDFNNGGTINVTSTLMWNWPANLTLKGPAVLDGQSAQRILDSQNGSERVRIENLTLQNGKATNGNGGAIAIAGDVTIVNSTFANNSNTGYKTGGAVWCWCANGAVVTGSTFTSNSAGMHAGAIYTVLGVTEITNTTFASNSADYYAGAVYAEAATITDSTFRLNTSGTYGGGVYINTNATVSGSTFDQNASTTEGGGIKVMGILTASSSSFTSNSGSRGAGINTVGAAITNSTISGNTSTNTGGGIAVYGTGTITGSTISGNSSGTDGGGIFASDTLTITNSTVASNTATGTGGGIHTEGYTYSGTNYGANAVNVYFSTIAANKASSGGRNIGNDSVVTVAYTFKASVVSDPLNVAGTSAGDNCFATGTATASVASDATCFANGGTNLVSTVSAIALGSLANNGGTVKTMLPGASSVLNSHVATNPLVSVTTDQVGTTRTLPMSVGALEVNPAASTTTTIAPTTTTVANGASGATTTTTTVVKRTSAKAIPIVGSHSSALALFALISIAFGVLVRSRRRV